MAKNSPQHVQSCLGMVWGLPEKLDFFDFWLTMLMILNWIWHGLRQIELTFDLTITEPTFWAWQLLFWAYHKLFVFVIVSITITITITMTKPKNPTSGYKRKISSSKSWNSKWQVKNDITRTQPPPEIHWTLGYPLSLSVDANVRTAWTLGSIEELLSKCSPYNTVLHWCVALISKNLFQFFQSTSVPINTVRYGMLGDQYMKLGEQ